MKILFTILLYGIVTVDGKSVYNLTLLSSKANQKADLVLTKVPDKLYTKGEDTDTITITWLDPLAATCRLEYGRSSGGGISGNYSDTLSITGINSITFTPVTDNLETGVYYCIISDISNPTRTSIEFMLIIEADVAPTMIRPSGIINPDTLAPLFRWQAVDYVPYYAILVSDQPIEIYEDTLGNLHISNINVVWQAITPNTSINYGVEDPSGYFDHTNTPPLIEGSNYNWIVLNNYGNNPGTTSDILPVAPFAFEVDFDSSLAVPTLISPSAEEILSSNIINFVWSSVPGAESYMHSLYLLLEEEGDTVSYTIWQEETFDTCISISTGMLSDGKYQWRIIARDDEGHNSGTPLRAFYFQADKGYIYIEIKQQLGDKITYIPYVDFTIVGEGGSQPPIFLSTGPEGDFTGPYRVGNYTIEFSKEGFKDTTLSATIVTNDTTKLIFFMRSLKSFFYGIVVDSATNLPLAQNAEVYFVDTMGNEQSIVTDINGKFKKFLDPGIYSIYCKSYGYRRSATYVETLSVSEQIELDTIKLKRDSTSIRINVADASSGLPIEGVKVTADSGSLHLSGITDASGFVEIFISPGKWTIKVVKNLYYSMPDSIVLNVGENEHPQRTFALQKSAQVNGSITDSIFGYILANTDISAIPISGGARYEKTKTNIQGYYNFNLREGNYLLRIEEEGYAPESLEVSVESGKTITKHFRLIPERGYIKGTVSNSATGNPIEGVIVKFLVGETVEDTTDSLGKYFFAVAPETVYILDAYLTGFSSDGPKSAQPSIGETVIVDFQMTENAGRVHGKVTDKYTNNPVPRAKVSAYSVSGTTFCFTDSINGEYTLNLKAENWELQAQKDGYINSELIPVTVSANFDTTIDFLLQPNISFVIGKVLDSVHQTPLPNASLIAVNINTLVSETTYTNNAGDYEFILEPDSWRILASYPEYLPDSIDITTSLADTVIKDFLLIPNLCYITGIVTDSFENPIKEATVIIQETKDTCVTGDSGTFYFEKSPGTYTLSCVKKGYLSSPPVVTSLDANETDTINFVLYRGYLTGICQDTAGNLLPNVKVFVIGNGDTAITDGTGEYILPVIPETLLVINAKLDGYASDGPKTQKVAKEDTAILDFTLTPGAAILTVHCMEIDSITPIPQARVIGIESATGDSVWDFTNTLGLCYFSLDTTGEWVFRVSASGYLETNPETTMTRPDSIYFYLKPNISWIAGKVEGLGSPVEGCTIVVESDSVVTGMDGSFIFQDPFLPNTYQLKAIHKDFLEKDTTITTEIDCTTYVNITLLPKLAVLRGIVIDQDSLPVNNAIVKAQKGDTILSDSTDSNGHYVLSLLAGDYEVSASKIGYTVDKKTAVVLPGDTLELNFQIKIAGVLIGKVIEKNTLSPVSGVFVKAVPTNEAYGETDSTYTNANGEYTLKLEALVTPTEYSVTASKVRYKSFPTLAIVNIISGDTTILDFEMEHQKVQRLEILPKDQTRIDNRFKYEFRVIAYDDSGRIVKIEPQHIEWKSSFGDTSIIGLDTTKGVVINLEPNPRYLGNEVIFATDIITGISCNHKLSIFTTIDSTTNKVFHDAKGMFLEVSKKTVVDGNREIEVSYITLPSVKRITPDLEILGEEAYNFSGAGVSVRKEMKLTLPLPQDATAKSCYIYKWNYDKIKWEALETNRSNNFLSAYIMGNNMYAIGEISLPLSLKNLKLEPNPFSPYGNYHKDGRKGICISFDLSSNQTRTPYVTLKIYNIKGDLIKTIMSKKPIQKGKGKKFMWDGRTNRGKLARNGRYILEIIAEDAVNKQRFLKQIVLIK